MAVEPPGVSTVGNRMKIERKALGIGKKERPQSLDPGLQQGGLGPALGSVRGIRGKRLLGENVQTSKQPQGLIEVKVVDVAAPFFVEQFQSQQGKQRAGSRNHARAGIASTTNQLVKTQAGEQGKEQKNPGDTRAQTATLCQAQESAVRDIGSLGSVLIGTGAATARASASVRKKKGGGPPLLHAARKRQTIDLRADSR